MTREQFIKSALDDGTGVEGRKKSAGKSVDAQQDATKNVPEKSSRVPEKNKGFKRPEFGEKKKSDIFSD